MVRSFSTGISGLNAHQRMLDVVSNNIANANTTAYKTQRTLFADLVYDTIKPASNPLATTMGGTNPSQVGAGVQISAIDRMEIAGVLEQTGVPLDMAIDGDGYFLVSNGTEDFYTRDGAFSIDAQNRLVTKNAGLRVVRYGTVGEPDGATIGFQTPGDDGIVVPLGATIPGQPTTAVQLQGNLNPRSDTERAERLLSLSAWTDSTTSAPATAGTLLNDLVGNSADYVAGDSIRISGTDFDGSTIDVPFAVTATTTVGDLITAINGAFPGSTASLVGGQIALESNTPGETQLDLRLADSNAAGQQGRTDFSSNPMRVQYEGAFNETYTTHALFYDERGVEHHLDLQFEYVAENVWNLTATLDPSSGVILDGAVSSITFDDSGSSPQVLGTGSGDALMTFQINGLSAPQTLQFSFGTPGQFDGLTFQAGASSVHFDQDGYAPGTISNVEVNADGVLYGIATNGERVALAQIAVAYFDNPAGLAVVGGNLLTGTVNSGSALVGPGADGGRGAVRGGSLEASNVDLAREFTQLIIAQRGFSANARTITVTDELLQELINIIR